MGAGGERFIVLSATFCEVLLPKPWAVITIIRSFSPSNNLHLFEMVRELEARNSYALHYPMFQSSSAFGHLAGFFVVHLLH